MRAFLIPTLCAAAVFLTSSLSFAAETTSAPAESAAQQTLDKQNKPLCDIWQDDTTQIPY